MAEKKKVLIVFATREGQTEKIAQTMARHLVEKGHEVLVHQAGHHQGFLVEDYDRILCGASMHAGGLEPEMIEFIRRNQEKISNKPNAFFLVLLSAATKDPALKEKWLSDARRKVEEQIPPIFAHLEMIAGALTYSKYSWPMKWVMRKIAKAAGEGTDFSRDYEYTDWEQVRRFAFDFMQTEKSQNERSQ